VRPDGSSPQGRMERALCGRAAGQVTHKALACFALQTRHKPGQRKGKLREICPDESRPQQDCAAGEAAVRFASGTEP